MTIDPMTIANW